MKFIDKKIKLSEIKKMALRIFGGLVKSVVDVEKEVMVVDMAMHADGEQYLLTKGSSPDNLWGINLYPDLPKEDFIEFDSIINIRPRLNNFSRDIEDKKIREKIIKIVDKLIER